jgi:hypothetical protein
VFGRTGDLVALARGGTLRKEQAGRDGVLSEVRRRQSGQSD